MTVFDGGRAHKAHPRLAADVEPVRGDRPGGEAEREQG